MNSERTLKNIGYKLSENQDRIYSCKVHAQTFKKYMHTNTLMAEWVASWGGFFFFFLMAKQYFSNFLKNEYFPP